MPPLARAASASKLSSREKSGSSSHQNHSTHRGKGKAVGARSKVATPRNTRTEAPTEEAPTEEAPSEAAAEAVSEEAATTTAAINAVAAIAPADDPPLANEEASSAASDVASTEVQRLRRLGQAKAHELSAIRALEEEATQKLVDENTLLQREVEALRRHVAHFSIDGNDSISSPLGVLREHTDKFGLLSPIVRGVRILEKLLSMSRAMPQPLAVPIQSHMERLKSGERGVSEAFIVAFVAFLDLHGCTEDVVGEICKGDHVAVNVCVLTRSTGLSLAESIVVVAKELSLDVADLVSTASIFNSYSWWGTSLREMLNAIIRASHRLDSDRALPARVGALSMVSGSFAWIDLFCASQLLLKGEYKVDGITRDTDLRGYLARKEDTDHIFADAIATTQSIVFQCSPLIGQWTAPPHPYLWEEREMRGPKRPEPWMRQGPIAISRAWCLNELAAALQAKQRLVIELNSSDKRDLGRMLESDFDAISRVFDLIDAKDSQISKVDDREYINKSISAMSTTGVLESGYDELNKLIKNSLREWLVEVGQETLAAKEQNAGAGEPLLLRAGLGELMRMLGKYDQAERLWRDEQRYRGFASLTAQQRIGKIINMDDSRLQESLTFLTAAQEGFEGLNAMQYAPTKLYYCMNDLVEVHRKMNQLDSAIELGTTALAGFDAIIAAGDGDGDVESYALRTASNLATALREAGRLDEAKHQFERCLATYVQKKGPKAGETLWVMGHLGKLYKMQKDYAKAAEMCRTAMEGNAEAFGEHHKATVKNAEFYAEVLELQERHEEATQLYCRVFLSRRDALKLRANDKPLTSVQAKLDELLKVHHDGMALDEYIQKHYVGPRLVDTSARLPPAASWLSPQAVLRGKLCYKDVDMSGRRVFLRLDLNVAWKDFIKKPGVIDNDDRIRVSLPAIRHCLEAGARSVVLCSHCGRPEGRAVTHWSLKPVAVRVSELLGRPVTFLSDCVGAEVEAACAAPEAGSVILLENTRFHVEEEGKGVDAEGAVVTASAEATAAFRAGLARLGDVYVNDAFATCHRGHASMLGEGFAQRCYGPLVQAELSAFAKLLDQPQTPVLGIGGGYKLDKIPEMLPLIPRVDRLLVAGGVGNCFLRAQGLVASLGGEVIDEKYFASALEVVAVAEAARVSLSLPLDWSASLISPMVTEQYMLTEGTHKVATRAEGLPAEKVDVTIGDEVQARQWKPFDIGPATVDEFCKHIEAAGTIFWNGPPGTTFKSKDKVPQFGSRKVAEAVAAAARHGAAVLLGGGGTSECFTTFCPDDLGAVHVCSGGGVALELMAHKSLPALTALSESIAASTRQSGLQRQRSDVAATVVQSVVRSYESHEQQSAKDLTTEPTALPAAPEVA